LEIWKDITGYEGCYQISNYGRAKSLDRIIPRKLKDGSTQMINFKGKLLSPRKHNNGYENIQLSGKNYYLHRLAARAFLPNETEKKEVNHKDFNKSNNHISNLEWVTHSENQKHSAKFGEENKTSKLSNQDVAFIKGNYIPYSKEFGAVALSEKFGVSKQLISRISLGKSRAII
jgi:hypothetical protein